ncbi:MFS transporter [Streptomyces sp. NPDC094438]|uniref:MFS transporter n=1 Tax=Streptomyces sp. NPDC094438 TaxID=3366061 RepID=UPI0038041AA2
MSAATGAKASGLAARSLLIRHYGGDRPQEFRGCLRAVSNIGISLGALLAGWVVQVGTQSAYQLLVIGIAISLGVAAAFLACLPPVAPRPTAGGPRWTALRDRPYLLITALDGIMAIQFKVLTVAIPLWLVTATTAPPWLISGNMLANAIIVIALQMRAGRDIDSATAGVRAYRRSGVAFLVSCALISLSAGIPAWAAATLLMAGVVVHTVGELWHLLRVSRCRARWPPSVPPASTSACSAWAPAWPKPSVRPRSSGSATPGAAAPARTSLEPCSP